MILKTFNNQDMIRLIDFVKKYNYILLSGNVTHVLYAQGSIWLKPTNDAINSVNEKMYNTDDDDSWMIIIEKDKKYYE